MPRTANAGMPLPPMSPLWKDHGKGKGGGGIHIVVCCCNEAVEELNVRHKYPGAFKTP